MRIIKILSLVLLCNMALQAQPLDETPPEMMLEVAEESLAANDYYSALDWFEQAYKEDRNINLAYRIADLNYQLRDYDRAQKWYKRAIDKDEELSKPDAVLAYARSLKMMDNYTEAIKQFNNYINISNNPILTEIANNEIAGIEKSIAMEAPIDLIVAHAGSSINKRYSEYSPWLTDDGTLYYAAMSRQKTLVLDGSEDDYHSKIFTSTQNDKYEWNKGEALGNHINRKGYHTTSVSISPDGRRMYFTRALLDGNEVQLSDAYVSYATDGSWAPPSEIEGINGNYLVKHPVVGELFGNEVLFFSSNMPGGYGGFDLYYSTREGPAEYSLPVNLGTSVNTAQDEESPFYRDGTIYFSSNGHPGLGGFDVYSADWNGTNWSLAANIGKGINSSFDEFSYRSDSQGKNGFFTSNRPDTKAKSAKGKTCCDDIYQWAKRQIVIDLLASVFDGETPLMGATIELTNIGDGTGESKSNAGANNFNFLLGKESTYKILVKRSGYYDTEAEFNTLGINETHTVNKRIFMEKIPEPEETTEEIVVEEYSVNEKIRLSNIYYDLDDDKILSAAEPDLYKLYDLMVSYPEMKIELSSHTDSQGGDEYNAELSQRRADSAVRWLRQKGISPTRMQSVGYGESQILNRCKDGVRCSDEEHRFNRRTEFKIIEGPQTIQVKKSVKTMKAGERKGTSGIATEGGPPIVKFDNRFHDFGIIKEGDIKKHVFGFTNVGGSDLVIDMVTACECTDLLWPETAIKPGQRGEISVVFKSEGKKGEEEITVDLVGNTEPIVTQVRFRVFVD